MLDERIQPFSLKAMLSYQETVVVRFITESNSTVSILYSKPKPESLRPHEKLFADRSAL